MPVLTFAGSRMNRQVDCQRIVRGHHSYGEFIFLIWVDDPVPLAKGDARQNSQPTQIHITG